MRDRPMPNTPWELPPSAPQLLILTAPSGTGKTSMVRALLEADPGLQVAVSHTTRPPRAGESDGAHYHFVDNATFHQMQRDGQFLEHAHVFGHSYGTSWSAVHDVQQAGHDVVLEIDWQGARQVMAQRPEAISIFMFPPSLEALSERLRARNLDHPDVISQRLAGAQEELANADAFSYWVVNDVFDHAKEDILSIVRAGRLRRPQGEPPC